MEEARCQAELLEWNICNRENSVKAERRNKVEGVMMGSSSSKECLNSSSPDLSSNDFVLDSFHPNTTYFMASQLKEKEKWIPCRRWIIGQIQKVSCIQHPFQNKARLESALGRLIHSTTFQSMMNAKLMKQRFWHCHENGLIKTIQTIPYNL